MIIVKMQGGLGNQLFQYATAKALSMHFSSRLTFNLEFFTNYGNATPREFELKKLDIPELNETQFKFKVDSLLQKFVYKVLKSFRIFRVYSESNIQPYKNIIAKKYCLIMLNGYWQSEEYFKNIRELLLQEFQPTTPISAHAVRFAEIANKPGSVAIHIRRGDYIINKRTLAIRGICDMSYYRQGYAKLQEITKLGPSLIFSDDISWCKSNLTFLSNANFVETNSSVEDLYLMTKCNHHIIANSSFSWWGAWLSQRAHQKVIAPANWYNDTRFNTRNLVPAHWLTI